MKPLHLIAILSFLLFSCAKKVGVTDIETLRTQAIQSKEFKELQFAYDSYLEYGKNNNTAKALKLYRNKPYLKDSIIHYSNMRDSLANVLQKKSDVFYSKYSLKELQINPDDFKNLLTKN